MCVLCVCIYRYMRLQLSHHCILQKYLNILGVPLKSEFKCDIAKKVVEMNIKYFTQLFLQLFIDCYEYYYCGLNAFMCIWITTLSLSQDYQGLTIRNPQWTQDKLQSQKHYAESFWRGSPAVLSTCCFLKSTVDKAHQIAIYIWFHMQRQSCLKIVIVSV